MLHTYIHTYAELLRWENAILYYCYFIFSSCSSVVYMVLYGVVGVFKFACMFACMYV